MESIPIKILLKFLKKVRSAWYLKSLALSLFGPLGYKLSIFQTLMTRARTVEWRMFCLLHQPKRQVATNARQYSTQLVTGDETPRVVVLLQLLNDRRAGHPLTHPSSTTSTL